MTNTCVISSEYANPLAHAIGEELGAEVAQIEMTRFADGEIRPFVHPDILGKRVIYIASMYPVPSDVVIEWMLTIDAIKRKKPEEIILIIPYMPYIRQSKVHREGESRSAEVISKILSTSGVKTIITLDLHSESALSFFTIPVIHLSAISLLSSLVSVDEKTIVVSPDQGSAPRAQCAADTLHVPLVVLTKRRSLVKGDSVEDIELHDDVRGKTVIIVDDIISTGTTIAKAAKLLKDNGARKIIVFAVHAVFSGNAKHVLDIPYIERLLVTNTIPRDPNDLPPRTETVSIQPLITNALMVQ